MNAGKVETASSWHINELLTEHLGVVGINAGRCTAALVAVAQHWGKFCYSCSSEERSIM